jgi:hypothetical protein
MSRRRADWLRSIRPSALRCRVYGPMSARCTHAAKVAKESQSRFRRQQYNKPRVPLLRRPTENGSHINRFMCVFKNLKHKTLGSDLAFGVWRNQPIPLPMSACGPYARPRGVGPRGAARGALPAAQWSRPAEDCRAGAVADDLTLLAGLNVLGLPMPSANMSDVPHLVRSERGSIRGSD